MCVVEQNGHAAINHILHKTNQLGTSSSSNNFDPQEERASLKYDSSKAQTGAGGITSNIST